MRQTILLISCLLVFVLGCNSIPTGEAVKFDIGGIMPSDIDTVFGPYSSGVVIAANNNVNPISIFDGNLSTGINNNWPGYQSVLCTIYFPLGLYVNNITVKPKFGGASSDYKIAIKIFGFYLFSSIKYSNEKTFIVNCPIERLTLTIYENGTNQFYLNDVIIDYLPLPSNSTGLLTEINELRNSINSFQNQIDNLNNEINKFNNFIEELNNSIYNINNTINIINQTQQQIIDEISNLWVFYNELNDTIKALKQDFININSSLYHNITQVENNLIVIENDITNIEKNINNVTLNSKNITKLQDLINITQKDIINMKTNLTELYELIPNAYNDTDIQNRILILEKKNADLKLQNANLSLKIKDFNTEINDLNTDVIGLNTELNNLSQKLDEIGESDDDDEKDNDDGAEDINTLAYGGLGTGILGIIIALIALAMLLKKKSPPSMPPESQEALPTPITPEQQIGEEIAGVVQQEQLPTPEVQDQGSNQMEGQQGIG